MKSIGILSHLVETDIGGKGKDTLLVETGIGGKGKSLLLVEKCYALSNTPEIQRKQFYYLLPEDALELQVKKKNFLF
jgi:hypothetical protein